MAQPHRPPAAALGPGRALGQGQTHGPWAHEPFIWGSYFPYYFRYYSFVWPYYSFVWPYYFPSIGSKMEPGSLTSLGRTHAGASQAS